MIASPTSHNPFAEPQPAVEGLLELMRVAEQAGGEQALYTALDDILSRLVPRDRLSVGRVNHETRRIMLIFERGLTIGLPIRYESLPTDARSLPHTVAQEGRVVMHTVPQDHDLYRGDPLWRRFGIRHVLAVPVPVDGVTAGVLKLYRVADAVFTDVEIHTAEAFGRALGLALAARRATGVAGSAAEREIAGALDRIARAGSPAEVLDLLQGAVANITGATTLVFRATEGETRFLEGRNPQAALLMSQPLPDVGARLARRVGELLAGDRRPSTTTTLFTDPVAAGDAHVDVRDIDAGHDLLATNATAISLLGDRAAPLFALLAAWPESVAPDMAARHAEVIDRLTRSAGSHLLHLVRTEALERQVAELQIVRRLIDTVARTPRLPDALGVICRTSQLVTNLEFVAIAELLNDHVIWHAASGARDASFLGQRLPVPPRILENILQHTSEIVLEDVRREPEMTPDIMPVHTTEQLRSTVILPVHVSARLRGILIASQRHLHVFTGTELSLLHQLAGTVATAFAANDAHLAAAENA